MNYIASTEGRLSPSEKTQPVFSSLTNGKKFLKCTVQYRSVSNPAPPNTDFQNISKFLKQSIKAELDFNGEIDEFIQRGQQTLSDRIDTEIKSLTPLFEDSSQNILDKLISALTEFLAQNPLNPIDPIRVSELYDFYDEFREIRRGGEFQLTLFGAFVKKHIPDLMLNIGVGSQDSVFKHPMFANPWTFVHQKNWSQVLVEASMPDKHFVVAFHAYLLESTVCLIREFEKVIGKAQLSGLSDFTEKQLERVEENNKRRYDSLRKYLLCNSPSRRLSMAEKAGYATNSLVAEEYAEWLLQSLQQTLAEALDNHSTITDTLTITGYVVSDEPQFLNNGNEREVESEKPSLLALEIHALLQEILCNTPFPKGIPIADNRISPKIAIRYRYDPDDGWDCRGLSYNPSQEFIEVYQLLPEWIVRNLDCDNGFSRAVFALHWKQSDQVNQGGA